MSKFELIKVRNKFHFNLKALNHRVVLTSEIYNSVESAENGIRSVITHSGDESNFVEKTAMDGRKYFILKATNGETIGGSQMYKSDLAVKKGIESVMKNAENATVVYKGSKGFEKAHGDFQKVLTVLAPQEVNDIEPLEETPTEKTIPEQTVEVHTVSEPKQKSPIKRFLNNILQIFK